MKGDNSKDLARENLKRISASFELELLRLIRTLNLISQSRELYKNQVDQFQQLTDKYNFGLSDFTIRLLDAERKLREGTPPHEGENPYAPPVENPSDAGPIIEVIDEFREYLSGIGAELERSKSLYINKLDSIYSVYNLELGASQKDLDMKLLRLQKEIAHITEADYGKEEGTAIEDSETPPADTKPVRDNTSSGEPDFNTNDDPARREPSQHINLLEQGRETGTGQPASAPNLRAGEKMEKEPTVKNAYVAGAVLIIIGVIVGVIFYDLLLKRWGVQEYADVENIDPYSSASVNTGKTGPTAESSANAPDDNVSPLEAERAADQTEALQLQPGTVHEVPGGGEYESADTLTADVPDEVATPLRSDPEGASAQGAIYTVKGTGANVRTGPGVNYDIVTVVREGQEFRVTDGQSGHWVTIVAPDGKEGWVSGKIIREVK